MNRIVAIVGTAGRGPQEMTRVLWDDMCSDLHARLRPDDVLASGGAAWGDHLAVHAFLQGWCAGLQLYLPAPLSRTAGGKVRFEGPARSAAQASNFYHDKFSRLRGADSLAEIEMAIARGAVVQAEPPAPGYGAFFARNDKVAKVCDTMFAYTFGEGPAPADGGTSYTWKKASHAERTHVPLGDLQGRRLRLSVGSTLDGAPSDVSAVRAAIAGIVQLPPGQLQERIGGLLVVTSEQIEASWRPRGVKSSLRLLQALQPASLAEAQRRVAQAFHDPASGTTVYVADRIAAGAERGVILHETVHRYGRSALSEGTWQRLVAGVRAWALWEPRTRERAIHDRAAQRAAGEAAAHADEELVAYAVEEAVAQGVRPGAEGLEGGAEQWLAAVVASLRQVGEKLLGNDLDDLTPQDLVDLAYALAQLDVPERAQQLRAEVERLLGGRIELQKPTGVWYSALEHALQSLDDKPMQSVGWIGAINAFVNKGLVKAEEVEWSGIVDWLELRAGRLQREDLLDYVRANGVRVDEVINGGPAATSDLDRCIVQLDALGYRAEMDPFAGVGSVVRNRDHASFVWDSDEEAFVEEEECEQRLPADVQALALKIGELVGSDYERPGVVGSTQYGEYTLPGGEDYSELLLTLPVSHARHVAIRDEVNEDWAVVRATERDPSLALKRFDDHGQALQYVVKCDEHARENGLLADGAWTYETRHWREHSNVIAHVRWNERTDSDGRRVLFVEELQSDFASDGRKRGFKLTPKELANLEPGSPEAILALANGDAGSMEHLADDGFGRPLVQVLSPRPLPGADKGPLYPAPFVRNTDSWLTLCIKRVIKYAVDRGLDRVAFISGAQSVGRYDLRKVVGRILYAPAAGDQHLRVYATDGKTMLDETGVPPEGLAEYVGAEAAERLINRPTSIQGSSHVLEGIDLKLGGEGMVKFYDQIVPAAVNKLLAKMGGERVVSIELPRVFDRETGPHGTFFADYLGKEYRFTRRWELEKFVEEHPGATIGAGTTTQIAFEITPQMRLMASGPLPLFSLPSPNPRSDHEVFPT